MSTTKVDNKVDSSVNDRLHRLFASYEEARAAERPESERLAILRMVVELQNQSDQWRRTEPQLATLWIADAVLAQWAETKRSLDLVDRLLDDSDPEETSSV